jgi:hypothetical protein
MSERRFSSTLLASPLSGQLHDPATFGIGHCVDPIRGLDAMQQDKNLGPDRNRNQAFQPVTCHYTEWSILTLTANLTGCKFSRTDFLKK